MSEEERAQAYRDQQRRRASFIQGRLTKLRGNGEAARALLDRWRAVRRDELSWKRPDQS